MKTRFAPLLSVLLLACSRGDPASPPLATSSAPPTGASASPALASGSSPSASSLPTASSLSAAPGASAQAQPGASGSSAKAALSDAELGALIRGISEESGKFPSDNYISNETSFLHVTPALEKLQGGAYIGVGPEQNFTYLAMLDPELAFVIDIRRDNMVLHLLYKVLFEEAATRAEFLAQLTSRPTPAVAPDATVEQVCEAVQRSPHDAALATRTRQRVADRAKALGISLGADDRKHLREALAAFGKQGLDIHYTMEGSARKYPPLQELLATRDDQGKPRSFLASDAMYQRVRRLQQANRVVPLVGDLAGTGAVPRLADELKKRKLLLRVFYVSNVEQYLFSPTTTWARWIKNVRAMPWADDGLLLRVYFDQGRAHPKQRPGHRTTSMTQPAAAFLDRAAKEGWKSWWDVAQ